jgi:hypothetical protein
MRQLLLPICVFLLIMSILISCKKDTNIPFNDPGNPGIFPTSNKEKLRVDVIKEVTSILKKIYKDPKVKYEVTSTIRSEYYVDETVLLKDLLTPNKSPLYQTPKFIETRSGKGFFKAAFAEELLKGQYPLLEGIMGEPPSPSTRSMDEWPSIDYTQEIWTDSYGVHIYFPYSEYHPSINPFDASNNTEYGQMITIVAADREADSAPGYEPYVQSDPNLPMCPDNICYNSVTVDDSYAEGHPVNIVGVGVEPTGANITSGTAQVYVVFIGDVKCSKQYDRFISFTGNGGGTELRFIRGDNYLQLNNNLQVTNPGDLLPVDIKRKDCRGNGNWKTVNGMWDSDWEVDNLEQVFGIYEEDNQNTQTFTGSLQTTLTIPPIPPATTSSGTVVGNRGYSLQIISDDDIIRQHNWSRASFYQYNQGGLNNGCNTRNSWTIYDCSTYVWYTMPTQ